jgi:uncharacterized protein (DUF3820 family)
MRGTIKMPYGAPMPRVVVDVNEEAYLWLQSQQGQWKPRTAVLREIIEDAMKRQQRQLPDNK